MTTETRGRSVEPDMVSSEILQLLTRVVRNIERWHANGQIARFMTFDKPCSPDLAPMVAREVSLSDASSELRAMHGPTPTGTAVIVDFEG